MAEESRGDHLPIPAFMIRLSLSALYHILSRRIVECLLADLEDQRNVGAHLEPFQSRHCTPYGNNAAYIERRRARAVSAVKRSERSYEGQGACTRVSLGWPCSLKR